MKHSTSMKRMNVKTYISNTYIPTGSYMVIRKALMQAGIVTIEDLCRKTEEELSSIPFIKGKNLQATNACRKRSAYRHEPRGNQRV